MVFDDIKIFDFTRLLPGPYATSFFVSLGAEVIKVEEPGQGDYMRQYGKITNGSNAAFNFLNRGKKSITIDMHNEAEKVKLKKLLLDADIIIESFRPGTMKKMGFDYESVKALNPSLIYCSITGFGQKGRLSNKAGHDLNFLASSGLLDILMKFDKEKKPEDYVPAIQISDISAALNAVNALLVALINRFKTGMGQYIDISITDGVYSNCMQLILPEYVTTHKEPDADANVLFGRHANYYIYDTKDNKKLCVAALELKFWKTFCEAIHRPDLIGFIYDNQKMILIKDEIQQILSQQTLSDWMDIFDNIDACVSPVVELNEISTSIQVSDHELVDSVTGFIRQPIMFSAIEMIMKERAPDLGEHNSLYLDSSVL